MTILEKLMLGLQTTVIGLVMVFLVLAFLILCVKLIEKFSINIQPLKNIIYAPFRRIKSLLKSLFKSKKTSSTDESANEDGSLVAAIIAAVNMLLEQEQIACEPCDEPYENHNPVKFRVRSIKEIK